MKTLSLILFLIFVSLSAEAGPGVGTTTGLTAEAVSAVAPDDPRPLAIVRRFKPMVRIRDSEKFEWQEARVAYQLFDNDTLRTEDDGYAVLQLIDNSLARVRPNSVLIIRGEDNIRGGLNSRIQVESGEINLRVEGRVSEYEVATPSAVAAVKGTEFSTEVLPNGSSVFTCFSGVVEIIATQSSQTATITRRRRAVVDAEGNTISTSTVSNRALQRQQNEYDELDITSTPKTLRLRFVSPDGQVQEIEIKYYEKEN